MTPLMFYLLALGLFALGAFCLWMTSPFSESEDDTDESGRGLKGVGLFFIIAALTLLGLGALAQKYSSPAPAIPSPPTSAGAAQPLAPIILTSRQASQLSGNTPAIHSIPAAGSPGQPPAAPVAPLLRHAVHLMTQSQYDAALDQVNAAIRAEPQNPAAYALRGDIYAAKKLWDRAAKDYRTVLQIDGTSVPIKFNLAQIEFAQKKYDAARIRFAALQHDPDMGDLAAYKVFICDLLAGHEDVAARELDAFNQVGSNASFYFANAAWSLDHQKKDDAREWLTRAAYIYPPYKFKLYADNLNGLGNRGTSSAPSPPGPDPSTRPKP